jgi:transposase-like protein
MAKEGKRGPQKSKTLNLGYRVPPKVRGIQVNACRNPLCKHFGVHPSESLEDAGSGRPSPDGYIVSLKGYKESLLCKTCNTEVKLKSNEAVSEELDRISSFLERAAGLSCPNTACANHSVPVRESLSKRGKDKPEPAYRPYGKLADGRPRYRCTKCGKIFSEPKRNGHRQNIPHVNRTIFMCLVNKVPLARICEIAGVTFPVLYHRIDFIHEQCLRFMAHKEKKLIESKPIRRAYISTDLMEICVNWLRKDIKLNVIISAICSVENESNYVLGIHTNYDPSLVWGDVEIEIERLKQVYTPAPFRKYARAWTTKDFENSLHGKKRRSGRAEKESVRNIESLLELQYQDEENREDPEVADPFEEWIFPRPGMLIHVEYTTFAHFLHLRNLLRGATKVRFFLDHESMLKAGAIHAFQDEILKGNCDVFFVSIVKSMTVDGRQLAMEIKKNSIERKMDLLGVDEDTAILELLLEAVRNREKRKTEDPPWIIHPMPRRDEPEKAVSCLTELPGRFTEEHLARLVNKASLHGADSFFNRVRRRISLLERPVGSRTNRGRHWYGYAPYKPVIIQKLLDIMRAYHNFVLDAGDKTTPAMKLGLAKGHIRVEDILYENYES